MTRCPHTPTCARGCPPDELARLYAYLSLLEQGVAPADAEERVYG